MQNRLVLAGIPPSVPRLPHARDGLRDLVEERACWVDRFAFLSACGEEGTICAAAELHIENVRNKAVQLLDGLVVSMDREGNILEAAHSVNAGDVGGRCNNFISFRIRCQPANASQAKDLIQLCPIESDDAEAERRMEKQTLHLPFVDIELTVRKSQEHGGTGTYPWRGGLILARQICHWAITYPESNCIIAKETTQPIDCNVDFMSLFHGKSVLELGAGAAGLPSMTLGKICNSLGIGMNIIASDGVDEIVAALRRNIGDNGLGDCIRVQHIDWNDCTGEPNVTRISPADTIIFADCIYNEECAVALSRAIFHLLKPGGSVIGVLPNYRVGVDSFEEILREKKFVARDVPIVAPGENDRFACSGGGGRDYRLVLWKDCR